MKTKFANGKRPWDGTAWERKGIEMTAPAKSKTESKRGVDITKIAVTDVPYEPVRSEMVNQVFDFFDATMKVGKSIRCEPDSVKNVEGAMRRWLQKRKYTGKVKTVSRHPKDGMGYVWWLEV